VATVSRLCFLTEIQWLSVIAACERKLRQRQRGCDSWAAKRKRWVMLVVALAGRTLKYRLIKHIREFRGIMCRYPPRESFDPLRGNAPPSSSSSPSSPPPFSASSRSSADLSLTRGGLSSTNCTRQDSSVCSCTSYMACKTHVDVCIGGFDVDNICFFSQTIVFNMFILLLFFV